MGPNGAGKSSLISVIAGSHRPSAGRVLMDGKRIDGLGPDQRARSGLGRTFQITQPFGSMTVEENVMIGAIGCGQSLGAARARARAHIERVGLAAKRGAVASEPEHRTAQAPRARCARSRPRPACCCSTR